MKVRLEYCEYTHAHDHAEPLILSGLPSCHESEINPRCLMCIYQTTSCYQTRLSFVSCQKIDHLTATGPSDPVVLHHID